MLGIMEVAQNQNDSNFMSFFNQLNKKYGNDKKYIKVRDETLDNYNKCIEDGYDPAMAQSCSMDITAFTNSEDPSSPNIPIEEIFEAMRLANDSDPRFCTASRPETINQRIRQLA